MTYIIGTLIALVGVSAILLFGRYLRFLSSAANEYRVASRGFFASAKPLVNDDETPDDVLALIDGLNSTIYDRRSSRFLLIYLTNCRWKDDVGIHHKTMAEFFHKRPELEKPFKDMIIQWFRAVTALSPIIGRAVRLAMNEINLEKAASKISKKSRIEHCSDNNHSDFPPSIRALKA